MCVYQHTLSNPIFIIRKKIFLALKNVTSDKKIILYIIHQIKQCILVLQPQLVKGKSL